MKIDSIRSISGQFAIRGDDGYHIVMQPGDLQVGTSTSRWHPPDSVRLLAVQAYVGTPSTATTIGITIYVNGVSHLSLTVSPNNYSSLLINSPTKPSLSSVDYITYEITSAGNGRELALRFTYESV